MKKLIFLIPLLLLPLFGCSSSSSDSIIPPYDENKKIKLLTNASGEELNLVASEVNDYMDGVNKISTYQNVKRDYQNKVTLSFQEEGVANSHYQIDVSLDMNFSNVSTHKTYKHSLEITNLFSNQYYYYKVTNLNNKEVSNIGYFKTSDSPRFITLDNIYNVRDLGGIDTSIIKQGLIYRGAELNNHYSLSENDLKIFVDDLQIKTDLDLRKSTETNGITKSPISEDLNYINLSGFDSYQKLTSDDQKSYYHDALVTFADVNNYPIYMHCYQGADRTGTLTAVIAGLMGISEDKIAKDYELTTFAGKDQNDTSYYRSVSSKGYNLIFKNIQMLYPADSLKDSVEKYCIKGLGLTSDEVNNIRDILSGKTLVNIKSNFVTFCGAL
jgi:protein-tyrosine phosphatase